MTTSVRLHRRTCAFRRQDVGDHDTYQAVDEAATGGRKVKLFEGGKEITGELDMTSMSSATSHTRGPADKKFEANCEVTTTDLDGLIRRLMESPKAGSSS